MEKLISTGATCRAPTARHLPMFVSMTLPVAVATSSPDDRLRFACRFCSALSFFPSSTLQLRKTETGGRTGYVITAADDDCNVQSGCC